MLSLILSIIALAVGPLLYRAAGAARAAKTVLDVTIVVAVAWLVLSLLPHSLRETGWVGAVPLVLGLLAPTLLERWVKVLAGPAHAGVRVVVVLGVAAHAFADGVALALPQESLGAEVAALPAAIVLHRLAEGLVIWWLVRPSYGVRLAAAALAVLAATTTAGFAAGAPIIAAAPEASLALFLAFVSGSLLHVAVHPFDAH
ncbi:MAG: hypothetical protein HYZ27_03780 [Deltaproteobacteria bacterium]|nr:hypothetical protein [Deltaproteobacteria bacterium]